MKKFFVAAVFIFILPLFLFAQISPSTTLSTSTSTESLILELQSQIKALQTRINELEIELGVRPSAEVIDAPASLAEDGESRRGALIALPTFDRALSKGMSGDDIRNLQQFLAQFSDLYPEGLITGYYGPLTEKAVQRWQEKEGIVNSGTSDTTGYGRIGPKTRARLNELIIEGAGKSGVIPPGLLKAPGLQDEIATTTPVATTTPITIATTTPAIIATTTPVVIAPVTTATTTSSATATTSSVQISFPLANERKKWTFAVMPFQANFINAPAIGSGGTIYVGYRSNNFYAVNPDGTEKWRFVLGSSTWSPSVIGPDDTIYVPSHDRYVYAINPNGTLKWKFGTGSDFPYMPAIDANGIIYVGTYSTFYAIKSDGTKKWSKALGVNSRPVIGIDGTVYISARDRALHAINPDGTEKWKSWPDQTEDRRENFNTAPAISSDGTIYIGSYWDQALYALDPTNGTKKWKLSLTNIPTNQPAIAQDGTIYIGSGYTNPFSGRLFAINPNGTQKWAIEITPEGERALSSVPAIGADGTIYIGSSNGLYAIKSDGSPLWQVTIGNNMAYSSPALADDGTLYIGASDGNLYAIRTDSPGLAYSEWPKLGKNNRNTGGALSDSTSSSSSTTSAQTTTTATNTTTSIATTTAITTQTTTTDTTAPVISNVQVTNITSNSATINWTTNEAASGNVFYSTDASVMISATRVHKTGATNATSFSIALSGLSSSKIYYYLISSSDASGNTATSTETLFTTLASGPTTQCNDAVDNDGDGKIDMNDLDCTSPTDNNEFFEGSKKVTVVVPNGGQQWIKGQTYQIQWSHPLTAGFDGDGNLNWNINADREGSTGWYITSVPVTQTYYNWVIPTTPPDVFSPGSNYKIRIFLSQGCYYNPCPSPSSLLPDGITDSGDATFTITSSSASSPAPTLAFLLQSLSATLDGIQKQVQKLLR